MQRKLDGRHMKAVSSGRRQLVDNRPTTDMQQGTRGRGSTPPLTAFPAGEHGPAETRVESRDVAVSFVDPQMCQAWLLLAPQDRAVPRLLAGVPHRLWIRWMVGVPGPSPI